MAAVQTGNDQRKRLEAKLDVAAEGEGNLANQLANAQRERGEVLGRRRQRRGGAGKPSASRAPAPSPTTTTSVKGRPRSRDAVTALRVRRRTDACAGAAKRRVAFAAASAPPDRGRCRAVELMGGGVVARQRRSAPHQGMVGGSPIARRAGGRRARARQQLEGPAPPPTADRKFFSRCARRKKDEYRRQPRRGPGRPRQLAQARHAELTAQLERLRAELRQRRARGGRWPSSRRLWRRPTAPYTRSSFTRPRPQSLRRPAETQPSLRSSAANAAWSVAPARRAGRSPRRVLRR